MSLLNLRFIRQMVPRPRAIASSTPRLSRSYSSKKVKPLAPLRPDLQPHVRRKQLQDMQIDLYPRIQSNGVVQTFNEFMVKFSAMQTGAIDDKQLVTIRGVCHYTRCCSPATHTQTESTRSIMYCGCPQKKGDAWEFFVYMRIQFIFAQLSHFWSRFLIGQRQNKKLQRRVIKIDILRSRSGQRQAASRL